MRLRLFLFCCCVFVAHVVGAQSKTYSLGFFTGIISPYSFDQGINSDPRYRTKYDLKFAPIGVSFGIDFPRYGLLFSPGIVNTGQNYFIVNNRGGHEGIQKTNLQYLAVPLAAKFYLIDLTFFKVSAVTGVSAALLLNGRQLITHDAGLFRFQDELYPILPNTYTPMADGVQAPKVNSFTMAEKTDFKNTQLFVLLGIRSDWNASEDWRVSFDMRVNFGLLDPRTNSYQDKIARYQTLYSLPGSRHEFFAQLTVGVSRYVVIKPKAKAAKSKKRFVPKKYPSVRSSRQGPK
ncbi:hypothetical protein [Pseudochryseolinea flava]|nr:hypothetical protein [Pseudochryseolinea flava]